MRCFTVHRRDTGLFTEPDAVLVKEGFCWPAFFFTVLWALWQRMWLVAFLILVVQVAAGVLSTWLGLVESAQYALTLGIMLIVGYGANDWRRHSLARRRYEETGVVCAGDRDEAELRMLQLERSGGMA